MTGIRLANCWRRCTNLFFKDFHFVAEVVRSVSWKSHDPKVIVCLWHQGSLVIIVLVNSATPWGFGGENEVRRFGGKFPVANQNHSPIPIPIDYLETWKILVSLKYWRVTFLSATWHFRLLVDNVCLCICSVVSFEGSKFKVFFICSIHSLIFAPESQAAASGVVWGWSESPKRRKRLIHEILTMEIPGALLKRPEKSADNSKSEMSILILFAFFCMVWKFLNFLGFVSKLYSGWHVTSIPPTGQQKIWGSLQFPWWMATFVGMNEISLRFGQGKVIVDGMKTWWGWDAHPQVFANFLHIYPNIT